jgi:hypothetical protein
MDTYGHFWSVVFWHVSTMNIHGMWWLWANGKLSLFLFQMKCRGRGRRGHKLGEAINFQRVECWKPMFFQLGSGKQLSSCLVGLAFAQCYGGMHLQAWLRRIPLFSTQKYPYTCRWLLLFASPRRGGCLHSQGKWRANRRFKGREATEDCRTLMGIRGILEAAIHEETSNRTWTMMMQTTLLSLSANRSSLFPSSDSVRFEDRLTCFTNMIFPYLPRIVPSGKLT